MLFRSGEIVEVGVGVGVGVGEIVGVGVELAVGVLEGEADGAIGLAVGVD